MAFPNSFLATYLLLEQGAVEGLGDFPFYLLTKLLQGACVPLARYVLLYLASDVQLLLLLPQGL